jgi:hypothetical protein
MKTERLSVAEILNQAIFIGTLKQSDKSGWLQMSKTNSENVISLFASMRAELRKQFSELSADGKLMKEIRKSNPAMFSKLWRAEFLTDPKPQLVNELEAVISQAMYIGLARETDRTNLIRLGGKDWQSFNNLKGALEAGRAALSDQFDARAHDGVINDLKKREPGTFTLLWKAKFLIEPQ